MPYFKFRSNGNGEPYGSFEVFYAESGALTPDEGGEPSAPGYYWWPCFPGCLPDGDPVGPFVSEQAAKEHALDG